MSFDTEFNFDPALAYLNARITNIQNAINISQTRLDLLNAAPTYMSISQPVIDGLTKLINENTITKTNLESVVVEINTVKALSDADRNQLYYFYTIVQTTKKDFMARMLFNHQTALADPNIAALIADVITPSESKIEVAKIIYFKYQTDQRVHDSSAFSSY